MGRAIKKSVRKICCIVGVSALVVLFCVLHSFAVLGGDVSSIRDDQARMNATRQVTQISSYSRHELRSSTGQTIREFVAPSGKIFAITWHGPWAPDLRHLLGSHFAEFQQAMQSPNRRAPHGPLFVQQGALVVELGGHMRDFVGRAYLSDQLPAGVRAEDIR